jgi:hypothetical protein
MNGSKHFRIFLANLRAGGDPTLLTYDLDSFEALKDDERKRAVEMLVGRLLTDKDPRAAQTLAAAGVKDAVPALQSLANDPDDDFRAAVNRSLARLTGDAAAIDRVAADIASQRSPVQDAFSAYSLAEIEGDEAFRGLIEGLVSPFLPTRINSYRGLFKKLGVEDLTEPIQAPLWCHCILTLTEFPGIYQRGAQAIRDICLRLKAGATPESLDLVYQAGDRKLVDRFWASLKDKKAAIDLDALRAMSGHDRQWAEAQLVGALDSKDPRVPPAVAELGMGWTLEGMREAREVYREANKDELVDAFDEAIARLEDGEEGSE